MKIITDVTPTRCKRWISAPRISWKAITNTPAQPPLLQQNLQKCIHTWVFLNSSRLVLMCRQVSKTTGIGDRRYIPFIQLIFSLSLRYKEKKKKEFSYCWNWKITIFLGICKNKRWYCAQLLYDACLKRIVLSILTKRNTIFSWGLLRNTNHYQT